MRLWPDDGMKSSENLLPLGQAAQREVETGSEESASLVDSRISSEPNAAEAPASASSIVYLAELADLAGMPTVAAVFVGACVAAVRTSGSALADGEFQRIGKLSRKLRLTLGFGEFDEQFLFGQEVSEDELVALARTIRQTGASSDLGRALVNSDVFVR